MNNTKELILGKDYCNYFLANPKLYQLIGWEINSEENTGIIKDKSTDTLRFYWCKNLPENECWFDQMLINKDIKETAMEYIYAYIDETFEGSEYIKTLNEEDKND